jgi:hypothetical protein
MRLMLTRAIVLFAASAALSQDAVQAQEPVQASYRP